MFRRLAIESMAPRLPLPNTAGHATVALSWPTMACAMRLQSGAAAAAASTAAPSIEEETQPLGRPVSRYRVKRKAAGQQGGGGGHGTHQPVNMKPTEDTTSGSSNGANQASAASTSSPPPSAGMYDAQNCTSGSSTNPFATTNGSSSTAPAAGGANKKSLWGGKSSSCADESAAPVKPISALQKRMAAFADKPKFSLTPNALYRIKTLLQLRTPSPGETADDIPIGIRVGIKKRGCSGLSYTVNYEPKENPAQRKLEDAKIVQGSIWVYVDADALFYVIGTKMDFTVSQVEEKFTFLNPNQKDSCGCGESFQPYDA